MELLGDKVEEDGGIIPPMEKRGMIPPKTTMKEGLNIEDEDEKKQGLDSEDDKEKETYIRTR
eukprot:13692922-Heterocapsa_arctica.AAC.1